MKSWLPILTKLYFCLLQLKGCITHLFSLSKILIMSCISLHCILVYNWGKYIAQLLFCLFNWISFSFQVPDSCINRARKLWNSAPIPQREMASPDDISAGLEQLEMRNKGNLEKYHSLLNFLMDAIETGNLWVGGNGVEGIVIDIFCFYDVLLNYYYYYYILN